jgi:hypothetical protein
MSKKSRKRRSDERKKLKQQRKEAKRMLYKSYSEKGHESAAKRGRLKKGSGGGKKGQHVMANCGNSGCIRCYPLLNNYMLQNGWLRLDWHRELARRIALGI